MVVLLIHSFGITQGNLRNDNQDAEDNCKSRIMNNAPALQEDFLAFKVFAFPLRRQFLFRRSLETWWMN